MPQVSNDPCIRPSRIKQPKSICRYGDIGEPCDSKLAKYRQALEAGTAPAIVGGWIEEVKLERREAELQLRRERPTPSKDDIRSLVLQSKGIVEILAQAEREDRRAV